MPFLVDSPTELTTAATDVVLALSALFSALALRGRRLRVRLWRRLFVCFAAGALLGAAAHAIRMGEAANALLWHPIYFLLALTLTLLAVIAIGDWRGEAAARRAFPRLLPLPALVTVVAWLGSGDFIWFVLFEGLILLFAAAVYLLLVVRHRPGSGLILAGIVISVGAAALQAAGPFTYRIGVPFDHNGLFHLVQIPGIACFYLGADNDAIVE